MKLEDGEYCRKVSRKNNTLVITIPAPLVKKMKIDAGQLMRISEQDGSLVYSDLESGSRGRQSRASKKTRNTEPAEDEQSEQGVHYVDLDDPNFNPINRLAL